MNKKLIIIGLIALLTLNPLSTNILADVLVTGINIATEYLILSSSYTMAVSGTLIFVGLLLTYEQSKRVRNKKLKSLKHKKTEKAGSYL